MTANSFTSLSLNPPLVWFCAGKTTKTGQTMHTAKGFSVNILRHDQEALSTYFAGGWKERTPPDTVLIAEDDPIFRRILESRLQKWNYRVTALENGLDAWSG